MNNDREGLSPEDLAKINAAASRLRQAFGDGSAAGLVKGAAAGMFRRRVRTTRLRRRFPRLGVIGFGVLIAVMSVATCSAGVDLASLTEEYGPPVPANREAARRFAVRSANALSSAPAARRLTIEVTEVEATSALSLGLMLPELMQAMESMSAEEAQGFDDLGELREHLRERASGERENMTFMDRLSAALDPRIRSGDVQVRFTDQGEIVLAGYIQAWRWQQPALVVFAPRAHGGELALDFRRGRLGRIPAPEGAFDMLGHLAASIIMQGREYAEVTDLTVHDGRMTFSGVVKERP